MPKRKTIKRDASEENDEQRSKSTLTKIDSEGDLVLMIEGKELLVSRKVLCLSSSVFRAMLSTGSPFLESQDPKIAADGLQHIELQEDNYEAMKIIAGVVHFQHGTVPIKVSLKLLDTIATACDKYGLQGCLGLWPQKWTDPHINSPEYLDYARWLFIALVFRNAAIFSKITRQLVIHTEITSDDDLDFAEHGRISKHVPTTVLSKHIRQAKCLKIGADSFTEQIKISRKTLAAALLSLCREFHEVLVDHPEVPVCRLDGMQTLCDAMNLGCLVQAIPELSRPRLKDSGYRGSLAGLYIRLKSVPSHGASITYTQTGDGFNTISHAKCGVSQKMAPKLTELIENFADLALPP